MSHTDCFEIYTLERYTCMYDIGLQAYEYTDRETDINIS